MSDAVIHPARRMPYEALLDGLEQARAKGLVYERRDGDKSLWCYTSRAVYEGTWDDITVLARGLVLDRAAGAVLATPFPKFFNIGEAGRPVPDTPFTAYEKLDGSLIIVFSHAGQWTTATKGDLGSAQALWARELLAANPGAGALMPGHTFLFEAIGPQNRIVVAYERPEMVLLSAYDAEGREQTDDELQVLAAALGWRVAPRHHFASLADLVRHADQLPKTAEGFVLRFADGLRLKVKAAEYRRIHALISRVVPLGLWEAMAAGDDLDRLRHDIPEEFWGDFDVIRALLTQAYDRLMAEARAAASVFEGVADRDVAARLHEVPAHVRNYVFALRKGGGDRLKANMLRAIRPSGNELAGYVPSYQLTRATGDE
jgi:RNA ligase